MARFGAMTDLPAGVPLRVGGLTPSLRQILRRCLPFNDGATGEYGWAQFDLSTDRADHVESDGVAAIGIPDLGMPVRMRSGRAASWHHGIDSAVQCSPELLPPALRICVAQQCARVGAMLIHAACLEVAGACWLVLGSSGAGKSTLAMAALATGSAKLVSDDWVMLQSASNGVWATRLRPYVALRDLPNPSWRQAIQAALGPLPSASSGAREILALPNDDTIQPLALPLTRILLLSEPGAQERPENTEGECAPPELVLEKLIFASVPLLFTAHFPIECGQQMATINHLLRTTVAHRCAVGRDLLKDPERVWTQLSELDSAPPQCVPTTDSDLRDARVLMNPAPIHLSALGDVLRAQQASKALSFNRLDSGAAVILSLHHGRALSVNRVGAFLVENLLAGVDDMQSLVDALSSKFSVASSRARSDAREFLESLRVALST